jgi:hypothetical protein
MGMVLKEMKAIVSAKQNIVSLQKRGNRNIR